MKTLISILVLGLLSGCICFEEKAPPKPIQFTTIQSVDVAVQKARTDFIAGRKAKKVNATQDERTIVLWLRYEARLATALQASHLDYTAPAPKDLKPLAHEFISAVKGLVKK